MEYLAIYEDDEQLASIIDEPAAEEIVKSNRKRLRLCDKKRIVDRYHDYINSNKNKLFGNELSMRAFVEYYNDEIHSTKISFSNLSKWVKSEKRGKYLSWDRINNLEAYIFNSNKILLGIDFTLKQRDVFHAAYNRVAKSPSLPDEYGVVARKFTPAGTFLGFYKGEVIDGLEASKRSPEYMFIIGKNKFIDARDNCSCFARYYNCAFKASDQNVSVERIESTNPQKVICFVANRDVARGEEFLISYGSSHGESAVAQACTTSAFRQVCTYMINNAPSDYETIDALYSVVAPTLAANFGDDRSDTEETKEEIDDSEHIHSENEALSDDEE
jgi:hypothetical protein